MTEGSLLRFRCRVGHAYTAESLIEKQSEALEDALWAALRALEESAGLSHCLAQRFKHQENSSIAARFEERFRKAKARAKIIKSVLLNDGDGASSQAGEERETYLSGEAGSPPEQEGRRQSEGHG